MANSGVAYTMQKQLLDYSDKIKAELLQAFLNMTFSQ